MNIQSLGLYTQALFLSHDHHSSTCKPRETSVHWQPFDCDKISRQETFMLLVINQLLVTPESVIPALSEEYELNIKANYDWASTSDTFII